MNIRAGGGEEIKERKKEIKYVQIEWVTTLHDLLAFYSVLFYKHIKDTDKALKEKQFC